MAVDNELTVIENEHGTRHLHFIFHLSHRDPEGTQERWKGCAVKCKRHS